MPISCRGCGLSISGGGFGGWEAGIKHVHLLADQTRDEGAVGEDELQLPSCRQFNDYHSLYIRAINCRCQSLTRCFICRWHQAAPESAAKDKVQLFFFPKRLKQLLSSVEENPLAALGLGRYANVLFALVTTVFHQRAERSDGPHA